MFRQKNEEKQISNKFIHESLNRPLTHDRDAKVDPTLRHSWGNLANNNYSDLPDQNVSTYKGAYHNLNRRSFSSFDTGTTMEKLVENPSEDDEERPPSSLLAKPKRASTSMQQQQQNKHLVESVQFGDNELENNVDHGRMMSIDEEQRSNEIKEPMFPPIKLKETPTDGDENAKSRKIRQLQTRLSRQEEEAKRQLSELQTKQSRLENALKLLSKQSASTTGKARQSVEENCSTGKTSSK